MSSIYGEPTLFELIASPPVGPTLLFVGALFGFCAGWTAAQKNRNGASWFLLGCFLGPVALWMLMAVPALTEESKKRFLEINPCPDKS